MSSSSDSESITSTPESIRTDAKNVMDNLLPAKSRELYMKAYNNFIEWRKARGAKSFSESVFLAYFQYLAKTKQPPTLWSTYSMLKATANSYNDVKLEKYWKLIAYLKRISKGFKPKKSKVFSSKNVETFLNEAPDKDFLAVKVALIFGVHGACRGNELLKITVDDVEIHSDDLLLVKLKDTKTKMDRSFVIRGEYKTIVQKYLDLRPADMETNRFFIRYQNGKCCKQVIGKNKIANMPQEIATYLKLPDTKLYTGHCFRRTSATLLANSGADLTALTRHGGWKSSAVAEGFIEDSIENKAKTVTIKNVSNDSGDDISNQEENSYGTTETFVQGGQHCSPSSSHSDQVKASTHGIRETGVKHLYPHDNILEVSVLPNTPYSVQDNGESTVKRLCTRIDDEYDAIGVNVAAKLRSLPFNMRVLAEKLINDVLFQAQINGLSPSTTITNPDLVKQDPLNN